MLDAAGHRQRLANPGCHVDSVQPYRPKDGAQICISGDAIAQWASEDATFIQMMWSLIYNTWTVGCKSVKPYADTAIQPGTGKFDDCHDLAATTGGWMVYWRSRDPENFAIAQQVNESLVGYPLILTWSECLNVPIRDRSSKDCLTVLRKVAPIDFKYDIVGDLIPERVRTVAQNDIHEEFIKISEPSKVKLEKAQAFVPGTKKEAL